MPAKRIEIRSVKQVIKEESGTMTEKFIFDNQHIADIDSDLLNLYRDKTKIPAERENAQVLRDVLFNDVLEATDDGDDTDWLKVIGRIVDFHKFKNIGDMMEYFMHKAIEEKLKTCGNCCLFFNGFCAEFDCRVLKHHQGCDGPCADESDEDSEDLIQYLKEYKEKTDIRELAKEIRRKVAKSIYREVRNQEEP